MKLEPLVRPSAGRSLETNSAGSMTSNRDGSAQGERVQSRLGVPASGPNSFERWLLRKILESCGNPPVGIVFWNGEEIGSTREPPVGRLRIRNRYTLRQLFLNPRVAFGECYSTGDIEIEGDLISVLTAIYRALDQSTPQGVLSRLLNRAGNRTGPHTLADSRDNVHHHYDIGNDFYKLWLDEQLLYTCAYYAESHYTLDQAQVAKMDHICRKLRLTREESVVEAGCGWGALAIHMARHYGVSVRAFNLSHEQIAYAKERAQAEGLSGRVEFIEDDYRNMTGRYDAFVSVGMLEHVGVENYESLGGLIRKTLKSSGRGLIHTIGRIQPSPLDPWTAKRIFPGAYPPSLREMTPLFESNQFAILDVENLRLHYARTLEHWLERFEKSAAAVLDMFDERFVRTWRMYLAGSVVAFQTGSLQLFQVLFAPGENNDIPRTREYMYSPSRAI